MEQVGDGEGSLEELFGRGSGGLHLAPSTELRG